MIKVKSILLDGNKAVANISIEGKLFKIEQQYNEITLETLSVFFKNAHQEALRKQSEIVRLNHDGIKMSEIGCKTQDGYDGC